MSKRKKKGKVPEQVKRLRKARRDIEIELQTPKVHSTVHLTDKKDIADKAKNTIDLRNLDESN